MNMLCWRQEKKKEEYSPVVCIRRRHRKFSVFFFFLMRMCAFTSGKEEENSINMPFYTHTHKNNYWINSPVHIISEITVVRNNILRFIQCNHVKLQPCSLSEGLISRAKSLRCVEGKQGGGHGECANRQSSDSRGHIDAGMNKKAISVFSGLALTQPCHAY